MNPLGPRARWQGDPVVGGTSAEVAHAVGAEGVHGLLSVDVRFLARNRQAAAPRDPRTVAP